MSLPFRAKQSTDTTGTGTLTLNAASANMIGFSEWTGAAVRRGRWMLSWSTGFEEFFGEYNGGSPGTLTRDITIRSSNANNPVSLPAGTKDVFPVIDPATTELMAITGTTTLAVKDLGSSVVFTGSGSATLNLPALSTVPPGVMVEIINAGTATLTIDPSGSETVDGLTTLPVVQSSSLYLRRTAGGWLTVGRSLAGLPQSELISNLNPSAVASVDIALPSGYKRFLLSILAYLSTDQASLIWRTSTDGGSTFAAGGSDYAYNVAYVQGGPSWATATNSATASPAFGVSADNASTSIQMIEAVLFPGDGTRPPSVGATSYGAMELGTGGYLGTALSYGWRATATAINALRILASTGNLSGNIQLRGIR